jgi:hypothetical protein
MARHSAATVGGRTPARGQQPSSGKAQLKAPLGLHFGDPYGSWGDNALSLLSAQASLSAEHASPRKPADMPPDAVCRSTPRSGEAHPRGEVADEAAQERQQQEAAQPCDSDGLTADGGSDAPEGDTSPAPVNSGTAAAPPEDGPNGSSPPPVHQPGKKGKRWGATACVYTGCRSSSCFVQLQQHLAAVPCHCVKQHPHRPCNRRKKGRGGIYADLMGREVDVPASVFDIQVRTCPSSCFATTVIRKRQRPAPDSGMPHSSPISSTPHPLD